jgi:hypothetical protein
VIGKESKHPESHETFVQVILHEGHTLDFAVVLLWILCVVRRSFATLCHDLLIMQEMRPWYTRL